MKGILTLCLLFFLLPCSAKFASSIRFIPCEEVTIEVSSCKEKSYSNKTFDTKRDSTRLKEYKYDGAIVTGRVASQKMEQCYKGHKIDPKMYRPFAFSKEDSKLKFFIQNAHCEKKEQSLRAISVHNFCDTPNALSVPSCFIQMIKRRDKLLFFKLKELGQSKS